MRIGSENRRSTSNGNLDTLVEGGSVLRTAGVLIAGALLGLAVMSLLGYVAIYHVPAHYNGYSYFLVKVLTGVVVGLFVGLLQKKQAGLVAVICVLPLLYLQAASPYYPLRGGVLIVVFILSEALEVSLAFAVAHHLSRARSRAPSPARTCPKSS